MDRGVLATAGELFEGRHYPGVVAMCSDALEDEPECVPLLLIRARAHIMLRRDLEAQADLRTIIRIDPHCGIAYRLLGELAGRRNENESAAIFFREALRLDPQDQEASDWLLVVDTTSSSVRPAAAAQQLPAPAAAAGRFPHGTQPPDYERPTRPFARGSERNGERWRTPTPTAVAIPVRTPTVMLAQRGPTPTAVPVPTPHMLPAQRTVTMALDEVMPPPDATPLPDRLPAPPQTSPRWGTANDLGPTLHGRPPTQPPAKPAPRAYTARPLPRPAFVEAPGFGDYLVAQGIITRERLRAAQAYQRSMKVQLSTAIVTLGLATQERIEWAAVAHQSQLRQD